MLCAGRFCPQVYPPYFAEAVFYSREVSMGYYAFPEDFDRKLICSRAEPLLRLREHRDVDDVVAVPGVGTSS